MGECTSRFGDEELKEHENYSNGVNDENFIITKSIIEVPEEKQIEDEIRKCNDPKVLQKRLQDLSRLWNTCKGQLQSAELKIFENKNKQSDPQPFDENPKLQLEIRKGKNIPNTAGCNGSKP